MNILFFVLFFNVGPWTIDHAPVSELSFKQEMLEAVNKQRAKSCYCGKTFNKAVPPVRWNALLEESASKYASQMRRNKFFGHKGVDGSTVGIRAKRVGYNWTFIGENLGVGHQRIPEIIEAWMESPSHCALIMHPNFKELGAGKDGLYWVQHFGSK